MPEFYHKLQFQRKMLLVLMLVLFVFSLLGAFSLAVLAGSGLDVYAAPWQERTAWLFFNVLTLVAGVTFVGGILVILRRRPTVAMLARLVERRHPELRENLTTAVEILERGAPFNPLEEALIRQVERDTEAIVFRTATLPRRLHPLAAVFIVIAAFMLFQASQQSSLYSKASYHQRDRLSGQPTGLLVEPGDAEAPRGSDLTITAKINRWERDPHIVLRENGRDVRYPMMLDEQGNGQFTLFDLQEDTAYRVETSSLRSPAYTVTVYDPPRLEAVKIHLEPPAYTRRETLEFSKLLDLFPVEGTAVTLTVETTPRTRTSLRLGEETLPFEGSISFTATKDTDYQLTLVNVEDRKAVTETYQIDVTPDEPPVADVVDPAQDTTAQPDNILPLELYAADDFGIARVELHVSVSGLPRRPREVFTARGQGEPLLERNFLTQLDIPQFGVEHGDVVSYYFTVTDNREPVPNVTQSDLYFVEVLKDLDRPEPESGDAQGGDETKKKEIDLRALIVELKRVIRQTYRTGLLDGEARTQARQELGADLNKVQTESRNLLADIGQLLMQVEGGEFFLMMNNALKRLAEAEEEINADRLTASIPFQEEALSNLVQLESFLKATMPPSGGGGQGSPSEQPNAQSEGEPKDGEGENAMSMQQMRELMDKLNRLAEDQSAQNQRYERAERFSPGESERTQLSQAQQKLGQEAREAADSLIGEADMAEIRHEISEAVRTMQAASGAMEGGEAAQAAKAGARASESLLNAAGMLDEQVRQAAAGAMGQLAAQAESLAGRQAGASQASGEAEAAGGEGEAKGALREEQLALNEEYARLMAEVQRQAVEMSDAFPQAGEQLARASREATQARTDATMQRSANALLYGRYGKAGELQGDAAEGLEAFAEGLRNARDQVPAMSAASLQKLMDRVAKEQQRLTQGEQKGGSPGEGKSGESESGQPQAGKLGTDLQQAGKILKNDQLTELGERMSAPTGGGEGSSEGAPGEAAALLNQAQTILQQYLRQQLIEERVNYKRQSAPPPDKYRSLVEEYFKNLAEEP
ncbi:hypothetical protein H5P28_14955 [Ruficoccus amylovorans]|uniref:DUF4175 family protein n=1 Tax=Ruficoccus amylovorans TaxID=1804625 RepID=A0A842HIY6_9BACT|nr:hypothetical protein [Ruficoccus amylovorans]MBC2595564.1 hypothetical protein [Ruficoccus amylovorans]